MNLEPYDAGRLGGDDNSPTCWWHEYIRSELAAAHDFYQQQVDAASAAPGVQPPACLVSESAFDARLRAADWKDTADTGANILRNELLAAFQNPLQPVAYSRPTSVTDRPAVPLYRCKCGDTDHLRAFVSVWAVISPAPRQVTAEVVGGFEWDGRSDMECSKCGWRSEAALFAAIADQDRTTEELRARYGTTHPLVPISQWRNDVAEGLTTRGYWEWVRYQLPFEVAGLVDR